MGLDLNGVCTGCHCESFNFRMIAPGNSISDAHLRKLSTTDGTVQDIGVMDTSELFTGLAADSGGNLYAVTLASSTSKLFDVNQSTGAASNGRSISGLPATGSIRGIACDSADNFYLLYVANNNAGSLYSLTFDSSTASASLIGSLGINVYVATAATGIASDPTDDTLYGYQQTTDAGVSGNDKLFTINTSTGAASVLSNAVGSTNGGTIAFDASGTLYLITQQSPQQIWTVNKSTGAGSHLVDLSIPSGGNTTGLFRI